MTTAIAAKLLGTFQLPKRPAAPANPFDPTDKEREVLHRHISMGTVCIHIVCIHQKRHVSSRLEAVARAMKSGQY